MPLHELGTLLGHLFLYYLLVLTQGLLDFFVRDLALLDFHLALVFEPIYLLEQHFATGFLLFVNGVGLKRLLNLLLDLQELLGAAQHDLLSEVLVVVLQLANRLELADVVFDLHFVGLFELLSTREFVNLKFELTVCLAPCREF